MRKASLMLILLVLINICLPLVPKVNGADLTSTFIRLSRQATSTSTGGLVCTTTPSTNNGTENNVQISFPSSFTVNTTASNWTVNTSNIPSGSTAWPGIGTATSVSETTVTFPSSDLSQNTQYCFNFSESNTVTTPSTSGSYPGTLRTRNTTTTIDSIDFGIYITTNDGISVTATVPATPSDFEATIALTNPQNGTFSQDTELTYTVTYSSFLSNPTGITVEAEWELGTVQGAGVATEDILDYVVGSASNGYNNSVPVIDTLNRKVYWTISPFPANTTDETVSFKLKTNSSYQNSQFVNFSVHGRVLGPGTQSVDSTVTSTYYNSQFLTPTPTPTCIPSQCPTPTPSKITPTPTPTPTSQRITINAVAIRKVSSKEATIFVATDKASRVKILYGTAQKSLSNLLASNGFGTQHTINISELKPKTRYYFRVTVVGNDNATAASDIFVFDTSISDLLATIRTNSLIVTSGDVLLTNYFESESKLPELVIPHDTEYSFRFAMDGASDIKQIRAVLRPFSVLGTTSQESYDNIGSVPITEIKPGQYIGRLESRTKIGRYTLTLQVSDYKGNFDELELANLYIVTPMKVIDFQSKRGIERVKVTLYYYNIRLRKYELLSARITAIKNPVYSDIQGAVMAVLPEGKYRAEISIIGFEKKNVEFTIGPHDSNYPVVELKRLPFSIWSYLEYMFSNMSELLTRLGDYINEVKVSGRSFELLGLLVIMLFTLLSWWQLSRIFGVNIMVLPFIIFYLLFKVFFKKHRQEIHGTVFNVNSKKPIHGVLIHFLNTSGSILAHARTDQNGSFHVSLKEIPKIKATFGKKGYTSFSKVITPQEKESIIVEMKPNLKPTTITFGALMWYIEYAIQSIFEAVLIGVIVLELIFMQQFGVAKVIPFLSISVANFLLWTFHAKPRY